MRLRTLLPTQLQEPADAAAAKQTMQRTRRNVSTRILCAGCTDAEARPPEDWLVVNTLGTLEWRETARQRWWVNVKTAAPMATTVLASWAGVTGLTNTDLYLHRCWLQMVARRIRCTRFSFNSSEPSTSQRNNLQASWQTIKEQQSFKIRAESFLIKMATTGTLTRSHDPLPPTITQVCDIHTSTLCSSLFFFLNRVCEMNLFSFELFFEIPCSSFFLPSLFSRKNQRQTKSSLFFQSYFCCSFPLNIFFFLSSFFSDNFSFHLFFFLSSFLFIPLCFSLLFLCSPFSTLSFSISMILFLFFLYLMFPYLFFLHLLFFIHSSFLPYDLDLFVSFLLLYLFFSSSPFLFFFLLNKVEKFLWSIFLRTKMFFFFEPFPLSDFSRLFSSLRRHFFIVCPMFSDFFAILHYYLSWFSSTNLLFGPLPKIVVFSKEIKKHWFFSQHYSYRKKLFPDCYDFSL